jgi:hypothetical protein
MNEKTALIGLTTDSTQGKSLFASTESDERPEGLDTVELQQGQDRTKESLEVTFEDEAYLGSEDEFPAKDGGLLLPQKDTFYFPKNAVVSSPYRTPMIGGLNTSTASNPFESSTIYASSVATSNASARGKRSPQKTSYASLDIIRSPMKRQQYSNRNIYDPSTFTWKPTVMTNKYNERFQYPQELAEAAKMNAIFFAGPIEEY